MQTACTNGPRASRLTAALWLAALGGCAIAPSFGPEAAVIENGAVGEEGTRADIVPFEVIDITAETLPPPNTVTERFPASWRHASLRSTDRPIAAGDRLQIRIWEVADSGLFATAGQRETVVDVTVANSGQINVPYAGGVVARGLTASGLRDVLLDRYRGKAIEPEVAITITRSEAQSAVVLGAVRSPGLIAVPAQGLRILDLIAQAGGASGPPWEAAVTVQRQGTQASVTLANIVDVPANNIVIEQGDIVTVAMHPRRFAVYGGVIRPSNIEIPQQEATLAYLLAEVGGLNERVAQARSAFVFRPSDGGQDDLATAYRLDFSRPDALLLAGQFRLAPDDITYVASAEAADFERIVSILFSPLIGTVSGVSNLTE
ncbi:MAG: SLBB domain-containing protein [Pseudomonadota bacterium]